MNNLQRISFDGLVTWLVIISILVFDVQAQCSWSIASQTDCNISCTSSNFEATARIMEYLEARWIEREECHTEGIYLTLGDYMHYQNQIVKGNWFTAPVKVKELKFGMASVTGMEVNAFNSTALESITKLTFPNMKLKTLTKGIFNGLKSLEILDIEGANGQTVVNEGVLDVLNGTLKRFTLIGSSKSSPQLNIDGFTGSEPLNVLEFVKYNYKLTSSITQKSFAGLVNVNTLDLSECQIVTIGAGAFDPISNSIIELNLKNNLIKTLPDGIFYDMLQNQVTTILLDGNKWDCECHLIPLKECIIENYSKFVGTVNCNTPADRIGCSVVDTNFCDTTTTTTTTTTTVETTTIEPTTDDEPSTPEEFSQKCYELGESEFSKIVTIKSPKASITVNENDYGGVEVDVDTLNENFVLLWFSSLDQGTYYTASNVTSCVIGATKTITIPNLEEYATYTFCVMDSTEKTVSPLDCISYAKQLTSEPPWLFKGNKRLIISMAVVACCITFSTGLAIGLFVYKTNQIFKRNVNGNPEVIEVLKETFHSNSMMRHQNRKSLTTSDNLAIDPIAYYMDLKSPPPLPARPYGLHPFDPVYDVVRDPREEK